MKEHTVRLLKFTFVFFSFLQWIMHLEESVGVITNMFPAVLNSWDESEILKTVIFVVSLQFIEKVYVLKVLAADVCK